MNKHSRFFTRHDHKIHQLLGELALRDMQSEQIKINQLINKQKATFHIYRSLKTPNTKLESSKKNSINQSNSSHNFQQEKENYLQEKIRGESNKNIQKNKIGKISTARYQRYFLNTNSEKENFLDNNIICLPELPLLLKKNSIETYLQNKEKNGVNFQSTDLAIIEEATQHPVKCKKTSVNLLTTGRFKQRSLATLKK